MPVFLNYTPPSPELADNILRWTPAIDEGTYLGTQAYRLRWVESTGDKIWTAADLALPYVQFGISDPLVDGKRQVDLATVPELTGLDGVFDVALTSVNSAGRESPEDDVGTAGFLEYEDARFIF